jgi:predicted transglutaminase-like cysteine proteinase
MTRLTPTVPCETPAAALAMYRRNSPEVQWTPELEARVRRIMRAMRRIWIPESASDRVWDDAVEDGQKFRGNCNAFAPRLQRAVVRAGIPYDCTRLTVCHIGNQGHLVLVIDTDQGAWICCNLKGCYPESDGCWSGYTFDHSEATGRPWYRLGRVSAGTLEGLVG